MAAGYKKNSENGPTYNRRDREGISQLKKKVSSSKDSFLTKKVFLNSILYSLGIAEVTN